MAHCLPGKWKCTTDLARSRCEALLGEDLSTAQRRRVRERLDALGTNGRPTSSVAALPPKKRFTATRFVVACDEMHFKAQPRRWLLKNALRELHQKRTKNARIIVKLKRECREGNAYKCPRCFVTTPMLTAAHVGTSMSQILDEILDAHPRMELQALDAKVRENHKNVKMAVCCRTCNDQLERSS